MTKKELAESVLSKWDLVDPVIGEMYDKDADKHGRIICRISTPIRDYVLKVIPGIPEATAESNMMACLKPETAVYIQDMAVLEGMRNKGIGTLLMNAVKEYGQTRGADFVRTQVFPQNRDGMRFYEKNGFREMMKTIEYPFG